MITSTFAYNFIETTEKMLSPRPFFIPNKSDKMQKRQFADFFSKPNEATER